MARAVVITVRINREVNVGCVLKQENLKNLASNITGSVLLLLAKCNMLFDIVTAANTLCLKKTGPLRLILHNFTNSQQSLIIFDVERTVLIQFLIY